MTLLGLIVVTWPLWTPVRTVPRLPIISVLGALPPATDFIFLGLLVASVPMAMRRPDRTLLAVLLLGLLMAADQLRWQPWAYHALLVGGLLASCRSSRTISLARWLSISVYGYAALAKLDITFAETLGPQFLNAALGLFGLESQPWSVATSLIAPAGEALAACLLAASLRWQRWRRLAVMTALAMHAGNIALLGPWAMGHSWGVLLWNVGFAWQTVVLFWPAGEGPSDGSTKARSGLAERGMTAVLWVALIAPLTSPWGLWDRWPSWGLYAPGTERATLYIHTAAIDRLPPTLQSYADAAVDSPWQRLRLDRWVIAETGVPLYPQNRVRLALAAALAEHYPLGDHARVVVESQANRFTGERNAKTLEGAQSIKQESQQAKAAWTK